MTTKTLNNLDNNVLRLNQWKIKIYFYRKDENEKEFRRPKRQADSYEFLEELFSEDKELESEPVDKIRNRRRKSRKRRKQGSRRRKLNNASVEKNEAREKFTRRNKKQKSWKQDDPMEKIYKLDGK